MPAQGTARSGICCHLGNASRIYEFGARDVCDSSSYVQDRVGHSLQCRCGPLSLLVYKHVGIRIHVFLPYLLQMRNLLDRDFAGMGRKDAQNGIG